MKTIAFEGGEGSGKGTCIKEICEYLTSKNKRVMHTREPGGTEIGEQIRNVIVSNDNTEMSGETEALLFAACRSQLMKDKIFKALKQDIDYIILDRFVYSSYVYQGIVRGVGYENVKAINDIATKNWHPDVVIYLDLDPTIGLKRITDNNRETNRLDKESLDFHNQVRAGYLKIAKEFGFYVVDANRPIADIVKEIAEIIEG